MLGGVNQLLVLCLRLSYGFLYSGEKKTAVIMSLASYTHSHIVLQHWILTLYLEVKTELERLDSSDNGVNKTLSQDQEIEPKVCDGTRTCTGKY